MSDPSPQTFDKYEICDELGKGGFATVYRARDPDLGREVALKILAPHLTWDPDFAERFHQEALIAANLSHPNIVTIYEIGEFEGNLFIAMELIEGGTLQAHMQAAGPMALDETVAILDQLADALDYAHSQGLIHRDVKPSNVLLKPTHRGGTRPILADFGLVKALAQSTSATTTGAVLGTVEYMAPEQADAERTDELGPATDIYALGIVAYHMLTGQTPFTGSTIKVLMAHAAKIPTPPVELRADLPVGASQAILKALAKQPEDRFTSASAFVEALRPADAPQPLPTPPPPPPVSPPPPTLAQAVVEPVTAPEETPAQVEPDSPTPASTPPLPPPQPPVKPEPEPSKRSPIPIAAIVAIVALALILSGGRAILRRISRSNTPAPTATTQPVTATKAPVVAADTATPKPTATPLPGAPLISDFRADPQSYVRGYNDRVTLRWQVESETDVEIKIEGVGGSLADSASVEVPAPDASTTYHLTAVNAGGETAAQVRVEVADPLCLIATGALNLRSGPGTSYYAPLRSLPRNTELTPLAYFAGGYPESGWVQVQQVGGSGTGWVRANTQYVACNVDFEALPAPDAIPPTPTATPTTAPTSTPTPTPWIGAAARATLVGTVDYYKIGLSPEGAFVVLGNEGENRIALASTDGTLIWERDLPLDHEMESGAVARSGALIVVGMQSGAVAVRAYDRAGNTLWQKDLGGGEWEVAVSDRGDIVYAASHQTLYSFDGNGNQRWQREVDTSAIDGNRWSIWHVATTFNGDLVLVGTNSDIFLYDSSGTLMRSFDVASGNSLVSADLAADGSMFAVAFSNPDSTKSVALYNLSSGEQWRQPVTDSASVALDGQNRVYASVRGGENIVWDVQGSQLISWARGGNNIGVSRDGKIVVVGAFGEDIVYDVNLR